MKRALAITHVLATALALAQARSDSAPTSSNKSSVHAPEVSSIKAESHPKCDPDHPDVVTGAELIGEHDFDPVPYAERMKAKVRSSWFAMAGSDTWMKKGCAVVDFKIRQDGGLSELKLATSTGDLQLDRTALASVVVSVPFPKLPTASPKAELACRYAFYYNPQSGKRTMPQAVTEDRMTAPDDEPIVRGERVVPPTLVYLRSPEHTLVVRDALAQPKSGTSPGQVLLSAVVTSRGDVADVKILQSAGNGIDESAIANVVTAKFKPATRDGFPVRTEVSLQVDSH